MRKTLALIALLFSLTATAQVGDHRSELAIGGGAGYVLSHVGFVPKVSQRLHGGMFGGLTVRYTSEKYFSSICAIVGEVNYAQMGWKEKLVDNNDQPLLNESGVPQQFQRTVSYLQVPVFARLGWGRERRGFQFFFQAGPQVGFYLGDTSKSNFERNKFNLSQRSSTTMQAAKMDVMAIKNKVDYGIVAGIGLEFSQPKMGHLLFDARFYYGLGDMYGNSKSDEFARSDFMSVMLRLTYLFDILKTNNPKIK